MLELFGRERPCNGVRAVSCDRKNTHREQLRGVVLSIELVLIRMRLKTGWSVAVAY